MSRIEAHVGGGASRACDEMGAEAYATGNHVAFASAPSLHTAAHEAAHTIQQRAPVAPVSGVGRAGDAHEQHADQVAQAVTEGRSAAALLDRYAAPARGRSGSDPARLAVQRKPKPKAKPKGEDLSDTISWFTSRGLDKTLSPRQWNAVRTFSATKVIPDRLFTGGYPAGSATPAQRVMMAGFILTHGTSRLPIDDQDDSQNAGQFWKHVPKAKRPNRAFTKGAPDHQVRGLYCGHFVELIWKYAGVTGRKDRFMGRQDPAIARVGGHKTAHEKALVKNLEQAHDVMPGLMLLNGPSEALAKLKALREVQKKVGILRAVLEKARHSARWMSNIYNLRRLMGQVSSAIGLARELGASQIVGKLEKVHARLQDVDADERRWGRRVARTPSSYFRGVLSPEARAQLQAVEQDLDGLQAKTQASHDAAVARIGAGGGATS